MTPLYHQSKPCFSSWTFCDLYVYRCSPSAHKVLIPFNAGTEYFIAANIVCLFTSYNLVLMKVFSASNANPLPTLQNRTSNVGKFVWCHF